MKKIIDFIQTYRFDLYMVFLISMTLFAYVFELQLFLLTALFMMLPILVFRKISIVYLVPILFLIKMSINSYSNYSSYRAYYTAIVVLFLAVDFFKNRSFKTMGTLSVPFGLLVIASMLSAIYGATLENSVMSIYMMGLFFVAYVYFVNTLEKEDMRNVIKILLYFSILITFQHIYLVFIEGSFPESFINRANLRIGWANINFVVYINLITIPLLAYLVLTTKNNFLYMYGFLFTAFGILLTRSRSANITLLVFLILLVPLLLYLTERKRILLRNAAIVLGSVVIAIMPFIINGMFEEFFSVIVSRELVLDEARKELFEIGWKQFLKHPIFGSGGIHSSRIYLDALGPNNYHNIFLQTLTMGVFGFFAFGYLWGKKVSLLVFTQNNYKWFVLIMLVVTAFVNGLVQPMYYNMNYTVYMLLVLASFEVSVTSVSKKN